MKTLYLGSFNAEQYWRDEGFARLPEILGADAAGIVSAMDELLFPLCAKGDVLVTRRALDPGFKAYLEELGFLFSSHDLEAAEEGAAAGACVFTLLDAWMGSAASPPWQAEQVAVSPYAVLPGTARVLDRMGLGDALPGIEIVRKVNSKEYSHALHERIGLSTRGEVIRSSADLPGAIARWDSGRGVLLKDPFGVSGRGNLLLDRPGIQRRVQRHLAGQEEKGLAVRFLVEPFLDRAQDFSCQMHVARSGSWGVTSIQRTHNQQFNYQGSESAGAEFVGFLESRGYFELMSRVAAVLHQDGYFGEVCVDSMVLRDDELVAVVEINARKSMGLINQRLDAFLAQHEVQGALRYLSLRHDGTTPFSRVLDALDAEDLLFGRRRRTGILPMSCRTLLAGGPQEAGTPTRGRLYFSSVGVSPESRREYAARAQAALARLGLLQS